MRQPTKVDTGLDSLYDMGVERPQMESVEMESLCGSTWVRNSQEGGCWVK